MQKLQDPFHITFRYLHFAAIWPLLVEALIGGVLFQATANTLDNLMRKVFIRLLSSHRDNKKVLGSRKGPSTEVFGAILELTNPRARISRSLGRAHVFSPLGEFIWYIAGSNELDHIKHYIPIYTKFSNDGRTLNGAYGPRIFHPERCAGISHPTDQWQRIINLLRERSDTRNAVIQIFSNSDATNNNKDVPCTCTLQFALRGAKLHLHVHMRSNDVVLGLPHDVFAFTMLQEVAARELGKELGRYTHSVASLHLYDDTPQAKTRSIAQRFLEEPLPDEISMPPMPKGDPWPSLRMLIAAEKSIREAEAEWRYVDALDPYWNDLIVLLRAHATAKLPDSDQQLRSMTSELASSVYHVYMLDRAERKSANRSATKDMFKEYAEDGTGSS